PVSRSANASEASVKFYISAGASYATGDVFLLENDHAKVRAEDNDKNPSDPRKCSRPGPGPHRRREPELRPRPRGPRQHHRPGPGPHRRREPELRPRPRGPRQHHRPGPGPHRRREPELRPRPPLIPLSVSALLRGELGPGDAPWSQFLSPASDELP